MENTRIIIVRHGQSLGNAENRYLGHSDWDLSEEGYRQAAVAADALAELEISAVYSSDLLRAHNTAVPHAERRGLDVIDSTELREVYLGDWEEQTISDMLLNWHDEFQHGWKENFGISTPPNGESVRSAGERMYREVLRIAELNRGTCVIIASHAAVIRSFWGMVCGIEPERLAALVPFPSNASFTTVEYDGERLVPISYSDDSHFRDRKDGI